MMPIYSGFHALQVQFTLGAWHTGLLHVFLKRHPARKVGARVRELPMGVPAVSGEDASMARAFPGLPCWPNFWPELHASWPAACLPLA